MEKSLTNSKGIYIHVPFCSLKCSYCNFYSGNFSNEIQRDYVSTTLNEIKQWGRRTVCPIDTIYFGGGTPSLLKPSELEKLLSGIKENFSVKKDAEITIEMNPGDDIASLLEVFKASGGNRVSLGVQSANESELNLLGRRHDFSAVKSAVKTIKDSGINNISVDLIIGIPSSTTDSLEKSISAVLDLNVSHISVYILKIEENTPLFLKMDSLNLLSEDEICEQYLYVCKRLEENGFSHYEISNFARPDKFSRHNNRYWQGQEYIGIGPSAYSYFEGKRFHYPADIHSYINEPSVVYDEDGGGIEEFVMLRLRLSQGLNLDELGQFGVTEISSVLRLAGKLEKAGLMDVMGNNISLTDQGMLVSNSIILEILGAINENL